MSTKFRLFYSISVISGFFTTYLFWQLWQEIIHYIFAFGFQRLSPFLFFLGIFILHSVLLGLVGVVLPHNWKRTLLYGIWSLPILLGSESILWRIVWFFSFWVTNTIIGILITQQLTLYIKPYLFQVITSNYRLWFFFVSLMVHSQWKCNTWELS